MAGEYVKTRRLRHFATKQTLWEQELDGSNEKSLTTMPVVYLEDHALSHGDAITYYAYADAAAFLDEWYDDVPIHGIAAAIV